MKNITKGEWKIKQLWPYALYKLDLVEMGLYNISNEEAQNNLELMVDAGTTANKCGLFPSELLEQRDESINIIKDCLGELYLISSKYGSRENARSHYPELVDTISKAELFIKKITKTN